MIFFGFSAGLPILLIFSSLSLWLREAGVGRSTVTFFSWAALGYSFKFVWAPLVDRMPIPFLTKVLGRRRSWILAAQIGVITAILWMAFTDPASGQHPLTTMAMAAVMLGFSSATQDIVIDAYRIESAHIDLQAMMASTYVGGYRIGMLVAGAGTLFLAQLFGSGKGHYLFEAWRAAYCIMAAFMLVGVVTVIFVPEPVVNKIEENKYLSKDYLGALLLFVLATGGFILTFYFTADLSLSLTKGLGSFFNNMHLAGFIIELFRLALGIGVAVVIGKLVMAAGWVNRKMVKDSYVAPVADFFNRYGVGLAWLILALVGLYRISDIVLGVISNVFYQDMGFSKMEIASVVKTFGLFMTIAGGFCGGLLSMRYGVIKILFVGALLSSLTNLLFMVLAGMGHNLTMLYLVISADNLAGGLASAAFVAFLASLTNVRFTAIQYAIFSSLMTLIPKVFGGYSGTLVDSMGYSTFFLFTALIGIPVLILVWLSGKYLGMKENSL
ncbi:MAG: AmpG family muropeptide MFS transporter [Desulfobacteraceae bacterium]|nr:AmpG family muropeptide MFS transporter [Desulfobacteraceae bacterium]